MARTTSSIAWPSSAAIAWASSSAATSVVPEAAPRGHEVDAAAVAVAAAAPPEADAQVVVRLDHLGLAGDPEAVVEALGDDELTPVLGQPVDGAVLDRPDVGRAVP